MVEMSDNRESLQSTGYDAPVGIEDDLLERSRFAHEIYAIATTGPKEWSVRVGVYGEWGTGKSSILKMVDSLAKTAKHIVVNFNPWAYTDSIAMWHSFTIAVEDALRVAERAPVPSRLSSWTRKVRNLGLKGANQSERVRKVVDDKRITLPLAGLEFLKGFLALRREHVEELLDMVQDRRVIVLIDDLDRTDARIVPEVFYALKEMMDLPRMSFICAFDPLVVGEVLKERHPGFGDGLRFLEKIIDYPRSLPAPTDDALLKLAVWNVRRFCPFVPPEAMPDGLQLLPRNPRSVRQFVRLLAVHELQVRRHYEHELRWPILILASALRIRHPKLASILLGGESFWRSVEFPVFSLYDKSEDLEKLIAGRIDAAVQETQASLPPDERERIANALKRLANFADAWTGVGIRGLEYQVNLLETPAAVTWKEFDEAVNQWKLDSSADALVRWIETHGKRFGDSVRRIFSELFDAARNRYRELLGAARDELEPADRAKAFDDARTHLQMVHALVVDLPVKTGFEAALTVENFSNLLEQVEEQASYFLYPEETQLRQMERDIVMEIVSGESLDATEVVGVLSPFHRSFKMDLSSLEAKALRGELCRAIMPRFADQVIQRLGQPGFADKVISRDGGTFESRRVMLLADGPVWGERKSAAIERIRDGVSERVIRENVFDLLVWFLYMLKENRGDDDTKLVEELLKKTEIATALWEVVTSRHLSVSGIGRLRDLPRVLGELGVDVDIPAWWTQTVEMVESAARRRKPNDPNGDEPNGTPGEAE